MSNDASRSTIRDVAQVAGVSTATVSRVLNASGLVSSQNVQKVRAAIDELGYSPNGLTRALFAGSTNSLGVLIGDLRSPFYAELMSGIELVSIARGFLPLFASTSRDPEVEQMIMKLMDEQRVRGVIVTTGPHTDSLTERMARAGMTCVLVNRDVIVPSQRIHSVRIDDVKAGELLARHLWDTGYRRIAIITANLDYPTQMRRLSGLMKTLEEQSGGTIDVSTIQTDADESDESYQIIREFIGKYYTDRKSNRIDAIVATSGMVTYEMYRAVVSLGISVPNQLALAGFDDFPWAPMLQVPLTVIEQPARAMGRLAAELVLAVPTAVDSVSRVFQARLIVRQSTIGGP